MSWQLIWSPPNTPEYDFIVPGQCMGRAKFETENEMKSFIEKMSRDACIPIGHGETIWGEELYFHVDGPDGEHFHVFTKAKNLRKAKMYGCSKCPQKETVRS